MRILFFTLQLLWAGVTQTPSSAAEKNPAQDEAQNQLTSQLHKIDTLNKNLKCSRGSHCKALPLGASLCGGPESYVVVSTKNKKHSQIDQIAKAHVKKREEFNQKFRQGYMGICRFIPPPIVKCVQSKCEAQASVEN